MHTHAAQSEQTEWLITRWPSVTHPSHQQPYVFTTWNQPKLQGLEVRPPGIHNEHWVKHMQYPPHPQPGSPFLLAFVISALPACCLGLVSFDSYPILLVSISISSCHLSSYKHTSSYSSSQPSCLGSGISNRLKSAWPAQASPPPSSSHSLCVSWLVLVILAK